MRHAAPIALAILALVFLPAVTLLACLWDTETLLEERRAAPSVLEVIVGKFPRHSQAYYEWRLEDRQRKLKADPDNDQLLDDIAVSHEKLGNHDAAIEVAMEQLARTPDRYETLANLGTFLIHKGDLEQGMTYIERAIDVNPDAHFGREHYQLLLVKFLLSQSKDGEYELPLGADRLSDDDWESRYPFIRFVSSEMLDDEESWISEAERQKAVEAIVGMMRFSQFDSPVLLDVLGELLEVDDRRRLAFRSYMSAAAQVEDDKAKQEYQRLARRVIAEQYEYGNTEQPVSHSDVMQQFRREKAEADAWFEQLAKDEAKWIAAGEDVDALFNQHYRNPPQALVTAEADDDPGSGNSDAFKLWRTIILATIFALMCLVGILATLWITVVRRQRSSVAS